MRPRGAPRSILVLDVGGTNIKAHCTGHPDTIKIPSGPALTPDRMVSAVRAAAMVRGWRPEAVSIGIPAPVLRGEVKAEPVNIGPGWTRFDYEAAFRVPVKVVNDAAMQALGSYCGGTMLFLGLGTGLGSALVVEGTVVPTELARLHHRGKELEELLGDRARRKAGKRRWRRRVDQAVRMLVTALVVDEVVIGGGNARRLGSLPPRCRLGTNALAILGGERLWLDADPLVSAAAARHR